jgi:hypothetical protein
MLMAMLFGGGWAIYAGAQELTTQVEMFEADSSPRFQFVEHFFTQANGINFEVILRHDRQTGQTWRFHAGRPNWTPIGEPSQTVLASDEGVNRYELMSHVYRDALGQQQEVFLRVDYVAGTSWKYRGMADTWEEIPMVGGETESTEPSDTTATAGNVATQN